MAGDRTVFLGTLNRAKRWALVEGRVYWVPAVRIPAGQPYWQVTLGGPVYVRAQSLDLAVRAAATFSVEVLAVESFYGA